jgi:hypothetical protein
VCKGELVSRDAELSSTATRAYRWVVIRFDTAVEVGRDEDGTLRWFLSSIGSDPDALSMSGCWPCEHAECLDGTGVS